MKVENVNKEEGNLRHYPTHNYYRYLYMKNNHNESHNKEKGVRITLQELLVY